ncbi:MAG: hypothetical protein R3C19_05550 [Planctomycetaceae bacterium]
MSSNRIRQLVESDESLVTFKADTTVNTSVAAQYLTELGAKGIPLIVVDGPGVDKPQLADFYTTESLIELIDRARGVAGSAQRDERRHLHLPDATSVATFLNGRSDGRQSLRRAAE